MNYSMIFYLIGWTLNAMAGFMTLPLFVSLYYGESSYLYFIPVIAVSLVLGISLVHKKPKNTVFYAREGFTSVALIWIVLSIVGSLPFIISGEIPHFVDAVFETASGFTTTGSSILVNVEKMSRGMQFWRSFTHWIGGMGVLVLLLAIVPLVGGHNFQLMKAESPGPAVSKFVPKIKKSAAILYAIYIAMTVIQIILLVIFKMPVFDAVVTAFGSAGTGGFGIKVDSMASYSWQIQLITGIFMMLFGVNFTVYYLILTKKFRQAFGSEELRVYILIIALSTLAITFDAGEYFNGFGETLNHAFFQVSSIITTTGFATFDFNVWPTFSKSIIVLLMFIGASAGSTGGGLKVSRIIILTKSVYRELQRTLRPRSVKKVRFDKKPITDDTVRSVGVYLAAYFLVFSLSVLVLSLDNFDFTTSFTATAATINNIGPGLEVVGPAGGFSEFSDLSKIMMIFNMLAGRLEFYPIFSLFYLPFKR
ncbi:MAG: TrkH family potassium uptake protein [Ruminococcaceae bacterium]|nr:TrkH family potassium uptake protein [Oscillospiraceae bacterium]